MPPKAPVKVPGEPEDPLRKAADWLRARTGPEARGAVLGDARVDVFRSKDFFRCLHAAKPPFLATLAPPPPDAPADEAKRVEAQISAVGARLLAAGYFARVDRVVKERSKGRKHVKFPRSVEPHPQQLFVPDGFYIWRHDAPHSLWASVGSGLLVLLVFMMTLFPVAPYKVKLGVLYSAMGLLSLLFVVSVVRVVLFTLTWVATGRSVWLLPNLYSDDVPMSQILRPMWGEEKPRGDAQPPSLARRLAVAAGAAALCFTLYRAAPEGEGVVGNLKGANKSILEMLNLHEAPKSIGAGGPASNATAAAQAPPPPLNAATAAAQALARGAAGPAGVRPAAPEPLDASKLSNLAPIPEDDEDDEAAPAKPAEEAAAVETAAQGEAAAEAAAEAPAAAEEEPQAAAAADEAAPDAAAEAAAETAAEL